MFSSWVLEHTAIGDTHRLRKGTTTVGRHSSSVIRILDSHYVSRHHAEIVVSDDDKIVTIKDLNSVNGICVNTQLHHSATVTLSVGDKIGIGVAVNECEAEDELTFPIYELKYIPIAKNKLASKRPNQDTIEATQPNPDPRSRVIKTENSASYTSKSNLNNLKIVSKPKINEDVFVISDDDEGPQSSQNNNNKNEGNNDNINYHNVAIKQEIISNQETIQSDNKTSEENENQEKNERESAEKPISPQIEKEMPLQNNKPAIHIPLISNLKKEYIHSVSTCVKNIFGEIDDDHIKNKLKEINPLVYNELTGKPLIPGENNNNHLNDGDFIMLSDEEEDELGIIIPSTSNAANEEDKNRMASAQSPNIFDTSLNESKEEKENSKEKSETHMEKSQTLSNTSGHTSTDNVDLNPYTTELLNGNEEEDLEEIMFSQALINDMKEELQADDDYYDQNQFDDVESPIKIKEEPDLEKLASQTSAMENSCWVISDEEDFDAELETKVSDWSNKIFSQSFSNMSMSQVFDLDSCNDEDDECEDELPEDQDKNTYFNNLDNLYNNNKEEDLIKNIEKDFQKFKEQLRELKADDDVHGENLENITDVEKELQDKTGVLKENFKNKDAQVENREHFETVISDLLLKHNLKECRIIIENTNETLINPEKIVKEKSPDVDSSHTKIIDADSPLIRTRRKSLTKVKRVASSSSEDEDMDIVLQQETITSKTVARQPPMIIDAPSLPKNKGKLRGVSAERPINNSTKTVTSPKNVLREKYTSIREKIRNDRNNKDLKRKWMEKSSVSRKRDKEREKTIKESRKDKLRELAEKTKGTTTKEILKRKSSATAGVGDEINPRKAKVKCTDYNRGAFLANGTVPQPKAKTNKTEFKIPKINTKPPEESKKAPTTVAITDPKMAKDRLKRCNSLDEFKKKEPLKRTSSIDATFSQQIAMPDELLLNKGVGEFKKPDTKVLSSKLKSSTKPPSVPLQTSSASISSLESKVTICKDAVAARALRTTNKITFASMEKNLTATEACKEKLMCISSIRSTGDIIPNRSNLLKGDKGRPKKTVRFNDVPLVHYIERIIGASRKVVGKDILPQTTHKDRRIMVRRNYPIIDNTDKIISLILQWSNEWLVKRDAAADAASEMVYPMPTLFTSFEHYKSVLFPLMKLEFASLLEREYKLTICTKKYTVKLEYVTENKDRLMLITKYYYENRQKLDLSRFDLVILESKQINNPMFAYLGSVRKGAGACNTMVFEVLALNMAKNFFMTIKELTVRPVIDNVRVEFGAFNAVYQLEATPLFQKILNPMELLQSRIAPKKKPVYRGCDPLNDKQIQVLLSTYTRIIDETTPNISLLQGPPGTGKSCVITNLALQTLYGDEVRYLDKKILICAQSNAAVDVLAGKLFDISMRMRTEKRFRLIRYGLPKKIHPRVHPVSLVHLVEHELLRKLKQANGNVQVENRESLRNQILQLESQIAEMSRRDVRGTVEEDMLLEKTRQLDLMRNISNQLSRPEDERSLYSWYLSNANVVCATLSSCVKLAQYVNYFDICIIDEATQCTEPWTLLPLRFGINSLVLVGDTQQLPATILSKKANELGLGKSMFTRIQNCLDNVPSSASSSTNSQIIYGLQTQYRMHPEICRWPNKYFYRNELINGRITLEYKTPLMPFSVLNLAYTQNECCTDGKITNNLEAEFVAKLLKALDGFIPNKYNSYGVITPYAHHRTTLENSVRSLGLTNVMVNTIDSYQGLEKDVIVISNARTSGIGFLSNPQRLNVALTRPKKCLILCGNFKSLEIVPAWRCLLQNARERNVYYEITTNCVNDIQRNVIDKIRIKK